MWNAMKTSKIVELAGECYLFNLYCIKQGEGLANYLYSQCSTMVIRQ